jgi:hypothetical protein
MRIFLLCIAIAITSFSFGQSFAPIGAKWYYTERHPFDGDINYYLLESVKDTLISNKTCSVINTKSTPGCLNINLTNYVYKEDSIIYIYINQSFQKLFDFKAKKNDSWIINNGDQITVKVDSIGITTLNSKKLKTLFVTYSSPGKVDNQSKIIENIGDVNYFFNFPISGTCDDYYADGLRCYQDANFGNYSSGIAPSCDYKNLAGVKEITNQYNIEINLTSDKSLSINNKNDIECSISIHDLTGKKVFEKDIKTSQSVDISKLKSALYIVNLSKNGETIGTKKIMLE